MKIIFKNVGQGDSILLQWEKKNESFPRIGIIDCKKFGNSSPILDYIKEGNITKIDFIVLSHPHFDHYSGMLELLNYCEAENIKINYFANSATMHPSYLNWFEIEEDSCALLDAIFIKSIKLYKKKLINEIGWPQPGWIYKLNEDFTLRCIAPTSNESLLFLERVKLFSSQNNELKARQAANLLSTIFLVQAEDSIFMLTSDATIEALDNLRERNMDDLCNLKMKLCQIPHHGSIENHQIEFWSKLSYEINCPSVVSAGMNLKYRHPHHEVLKDFHNHNFRIYATNHVNGVQDYFDELANSRSRNLGVIGKIIDNIEQEGDQVFKLTANGAIFSPIVKL